MTKRPSYAIAYCNGQIIPASDLHVSPIDSGFVQGVTVAEQLRTFGGKIFRLEEHLERLQNSLRIVGIDLDRPVKSLADDCREVVQNNWALLDPADDIGLCIFVTPGTYPAFAEGQPIQPQVAMHTCPVAFQTFSHLYDQGQALVVPAVRQVAENCWPPELKCRSRMHYFLADKQARQQQTGARALMLDADDFVMETTTANIALLVEDEGLVMPPAEKVIAGVSVNELVDLAERQGIACVRRDITMTDVHNANEVLMTSTSPCVLAVTEVDGVSIGSGQPGGTYQSLLNAWSNEVGVDIREQAIRFSRRYA